MTITLKHIAREVGVSAQAVSYALNDVPGKVSEDTRRQILAAAARLNYQPNHRARSLVQKRSNCIGLVYGRQVSYVQASPLFAALVEELNQLDQTLMMIPSIGPIDAWSHRLRDGRIDGCLVTYPAPLDLETFVARHNVPTVLINLRGDENTPQVVFNDAAGAKQATRHLLAMGHRRIAFYATPKLHGSHYSHPARLQGYESAMRGAGLSPVAVTAEPNQWALELRNAKPSDRPTGVLAYSDRDAGRLIRELHGLGLDVPRDISLVGYNDESFLQWMQPPLSSVAPDWSGAAKAAVRMILARIEDDAATSPDNNVCVLGEKLVVRDSVALPPDPSASP